MLETNPATVLAKRLADGFDDDALNKGVFAEADFAFGGMDVHIHAGGIDFQEEETNRITSPHERGMIGLDQPIINGPAINGARIDKAIKLAAIGSAQPRFACQTMEANAVTREIDRHELRRKLGAVKGAHPLE